MLCTLCRLPASFPASFAAFFAASFPVPAADSSPAASLPSRLGVALATFGWIRLDWMGLDCVGFCAGVE